VWKFPLEGYPGKGAMWERFGDGGKLPVAMVSTPTPSIKDIIDEGEELGIEDVVKASGLRSINKNTSASPRFKREGYQRSAEVDSVLTDDEEPQSLPFPGKSEPSSERRPQKSSPFQRKEKPRVCLGEKILCQAVSAVCLLLRRRISSHRPLHQLKYVLDEVVQDAKDRDEALGLVINKQRKEIEFLGDQVESLKHFGQGATRPGFTPCLKAKTVKELQGQLNSSAIVNSDELK